MGRTGDKLKDHENRIYELETQIRRLLNDLRVRNEHKDFTNAEGLDQT